MSDSVRPHRQKPTRLPHPWDSPGKNTGVGCHFLLQCMKVKSESEVAHPALLLATPQTAAYQAPPSMGFSRQEYWSGLPLPSPYFIYKSKQIKKYTLRGLICPKPIQPLSPPRTALHINIVFIPPMVLLAIEVNINTCHYFHYFTAPETADYVCSLYLASSHALELYLCQYGEAVLILLFIAALMALYCWTRGLFQSFAITMSQ